MSLGSVLITGANRGIGLEFVKQFIALPSPPKHLFATCRSPEKADVSGLLVDNYHHYLVLKMSLGSVLITGANRGIGLEFVKQFIALPSPPKHLFATCRSPEKADVSGLLVDNYHHYLVLKMSLGSVLITGANRGIGLEFVKQFIALPSPPKHLFATCRSPEKADDLQKIAKACPNLKILKLDVKDTESFPDLQQQIASVVGDCGLNLLINNAGIMYPDSLDKVTKETMMDNFEVNAVSPLLLTKELLPLLKKAASRVNTKSLSSKRSAVVNVTSKMGSIDDNTSGSYYPYRTSKTALNMITKSLSVDLKPVGILAFLLHPGWVITDMGGKNALITAETSVSGMLNTILNATDEHCGGFFNYDGKKILW